LASTRRFNIAVAFERSGHGGRAIAQSSFHHFTDYNWAPEAGCPSFVSEPAGDAITRFPEALRSTKQYVRNVAFWLGAGSRPTPGACSASRWHVSGIDASRESLQFRLRSYRSTKRSPSIEAQTGMRMHRHASRQLTRRQA